MTRSGAFIIALQCGVAITATTAFVPKSLQRVKFVDRSEVSRHQNRKPVVISPTSKNGNNMPPLFFRDDKIVDGATIPTLDLPHKLNWKFHGLTLWLELEEYRSDITNAISDLATQYHTEQIPKSHTTAIYGMTHLTVDEARRRLHQVKDVLPSWPKFAPPTGVVSDIAVCGRPGQVCSIAWCELTLATDDEHETALDTLYGLFYDGVNKGRGRTVTRDRPWKPHNSVAYDNPEEATFSLGHLIKYVADHPSLITRERRVEAISLWDTNGRMEDWRCLDRVYF